MMCWLWDAKSEFRKRSLKVTQPEGGRGHRRGRRGQKGGEGCRREPEGSLNLGLPSPCMPHSAMGTLEGQAPARRTQLSGHPTAVDVPVTEEGAEAQRAKWLAQGHALTHGRCGVGPSPQSCLVFPIPDCPSGHTVPPSWRQLKPGILSPLPERD